MILSERGAIKSAVADGGFHLYPAGRLLDIIKAELAGDELKGDFNPQMTVEKVSRVALPQSGAAREIAGEDIKLLCDRLSIMGPEYNIEPVFDRMMAAVPSMAKRYYGIENIEVARPTIVEYFFEGHNDLYKDGDWMAFNVDRSESRDLHVPVGIYFKRNQVSPGYPEFATLHEANHAMQEVAANKEGLHHYIPWFVEGFGDAFAYMMLYRVTENEGLLRKLKNFRTDVGVTDPRKVTYHYGDETAILSLLRGRLPFVKALMSARKRNPFCIDWDRFANEVKTGFDPHIALINACPAGRKDAFRKRFEREENSFRKKSDLDQLDLKVLSMFLATQPPACLGPAEYRAALWFSGELARSPNPHFVDPNTIPNELRSKINGWNKDEPLLAQAVPSEIWDKVPELEIKVLIREDSVPAEYKDGASTLAAMYFIIKRRIGEVTVFEPYGGGLPYRLATGEIRCSY